MSIDSTRQDYDEMLPRWQLVDDVIKRRDIKRYLRNLKRCIRNEQGILEDNIRQREYEKNAVFYGITSHTLKGLLGTMFRRDPTVVVPPELQYVVTNIDGKGNGITQHSRKTSANVISKGRCGLWVDYPEVDRDTSRADLARYYATIRRFAAQQVISWRVESDGSQMVLTHVVLKYKREVAKENGYGMKYEDIIVELQLIQDSGRWVYRCREWQKGSTDDQEQWIAQEWKQPRNRNGVPLDYIPFIFVGSENNDTEIDDPPLFDMCELNIAHYRNSADYEDNVWYAGQVQPWMSGATEEFYEMAKKYEIRIGSRQLFPVPSGEKFGFETPGENPQCRIAMKDKLEMMIGIGARFITPGGAAKTAYEAESDREVAHSILSTIAQNVTSAYMTCLTWMLDFMPEASSDDLNFAIESDYSDVGSTPQLLAAWVKSYLDGAVPQDQYISWMQRQGYFDAEADLDELADALNGEALETETAGSAGD